MRVGFQVNVRQSVLILLSLTACHASSAPTPYKAKTSNALINDFVAQLQRRDEPAVANRIAVFETITGRYPQFRSAGEYLDGIKGCAVVRVAQKGTDAADKTVYVDPSLSSGARAARVLAHVYWVEWTCPSGQYRQALNADFQKPKIMVSEMISAAEEPNPAKGVLRPPIEAN